MAKPGREEDQCLEGLPSGKVYKAFDDNVGNSTCAFTEKISNWESYIYIDNYKDKIKHGLCYASEKKDQEELHGKACQFLYYWLGEKMKEIRGDSSFPNVIANVHNLLTEYGSILQCTDIYPSVSWYIFSERKKLFDYKYGYSTLKKQSGSNGCSCKQQYDEYLHKAVGAHSALVSMCESDGSPYCTEFKAPSGGRNNHGLQELPCSTASAVLLPSKEEEEEEYMPEEELEQKLEQQEEEELEGLNSGREYKWLGRSTTESCVHYDQTFDYDEREKVKGELQTSGVNEGNGEKVLGGWCKAHQKKGSDLSNSDYCYYLYFWLWDLLYKELKDMRKVSTVMNEIYTKLAPWGKGKSCSTIYKITKSFPFDRMKSIYDYHQDKETIKGKLSSEGNKCSKALSKYLKKALSAYTKIKTKCEVPGKNGKKSDYCTDFSRKYEQYLTELSTLANCTIPAVQQQEQEEQQQQQQEEQQAQIQFLGPASGGSVLPAVSAAGGLAVIGVPFVSFFLYKYNLLPPWISNKFKRGSNRSRKRRFAVERNFETLTADTSTLYSTESLTADSSSTTMDTSTHYSTDNSTLYNEERSSRPSPPPGQRRRVANNNNRQPKNIVYQRI
ncbi:Uncharacterized protein PCOAH_00013060 [Plasmodium coatneyi]|uniref:KIR protein n=1 Tax=Plasmodium coatneyi TaxID=208452 RepID=A0A1B1DWA4_9APIC|nr:Uncharacterized protein PCOAH_00013060 [Plasmodium coatneyi]ANQ07062.1 Uncharacterized protein PCOAH_00013060 [Plasmodium coatneyi]